METGRLRKPTPGVSQPSMFEAVVAGAEGIANAEAGAGDDWNDLAHSQLHEYLETHAEFHVDPFWEWWYGRELPVPPEKRAMGAVIQWASRSHLMEQTGEYRPSVRSHGTGKPVWRSLVFR